MTASVLRALPVLAALVAGPALASPADDMRAVADQDTRYQAAVKANDAATMADILLDNFVLVTGSGAAYDKDALVKSARDRDIVWIHQEEEPGSQTVRLYGDTAVITAKLHLAWDKDGKSNDKWLWFSDTYVRTPTGWRYAFGQSSLALPKP